MPAAEFRQCQVIQRVAREKMEVNSQQQLWKNLFGHVPDKTSTEFSVRFNDVRDTFARVECCDLSDILPCRIEKLVPGRE